MSYLITLIVNINIIKI